MSAFTSLYSQNISVEIRFANPDRDRKYVSSFSMLTLKDLMKRAHVNSILITSTYRSEEEQARVMLSNLKPGPGSMYAGPGRQVEQVGKRYAEERQTIQDGIAHGFDPNRPLPRLTETREQVECKMALQIHALERHKGVGCVSRHQQNPSVINVIDVDPMHLAPPNKLIAFIKELTKSASIQRIGLPGGVTPFSRKHFTESVRCLHVEILQVGDYPTNSNVA